MSSVALNDVCEEEEKVDFVCLCELENIDHSIVLPVHESDLTTPGIVIRKDLCDPERHTHARMRTHARARAHTHTRVHVKTNNYTPMYSMFTLLELLVDK